MPSNTNNTTPVPPGAVPYIENGLTYQSNNPDFVERDDNGNIIVNQGATDNQNLVLESISLFYVNRSVVSNIDTRFKYFRFPAENVAVPDISFEGFGIDDLLSAVPGEIPAKYRPSEIFRIQSKTPEIIGILMDEVVKGLPQTYTNTFEVTREIKDSGADLRFAGRIRHSYFSSGFVQSSPYQNDNTAVISDTIYFTLIKLDYETGQLNRLFRVLSFSDGTEDPATDETFIYPGTTKIKTFNIVIPNSDFDTGDLFQLGVTVGQYDDGTPGANGTTLRRIHEILRFGTSWLIKDADEPFDFDELADPN